MALEAREHDAVNYHDEMVGRVLEPPSLVGPHGFVIGPVPLSISWRRQPDMVLERLHPCQSNIVISETVRVGAVDSSHAPLRTRR